MEKLTLEKCMMLAINEQAKCTVYPKVGCIIVNDGQLLSTGYAGEIDGKHAERIAIEKMNKNNLTNIDKIIIFTTLEPCVNIYQDNKYQSCSQLIVNTGIKQIYIGVLDPNGNVYTKGLKYLLDNNIDVKFFYQKFRDIIEQTSFKYGSITNIISENGKRIFPILDNGLIIIFANPNNTSDKIEIRFDKVNYESKFVYMYGPNDSITEASGVSRFSQITDCAVFRFPNYFATMVVGKFAIITTTTSKFYIIVKLNEIYETGVLITWELRTKL